MRMVQNLAGRRGKGLKYVEVRWSGIQRLEVQMSRVYRASAEKDPNFKGSSCRDSCSNTSLSVEIVLKSCKGWWSIGSV